MNNDDRHPGHREPRRRSRRRRAGPRTGGLTAALIAAGLLAAACGGPAGPGVTNAGPAASASPSASGHGSALAYARCMRSHGITQFPDPDSNGDIGINGGPGTGLDPHSPQFKAADQACKPLLPPAQHPNTQQMKAANLNYAKCMRAHGISDFPDPGADGRLRVQDKPGTDLDPNNPQYKTADTACKHYLPNGGKGGSLTQSGEGGGGS
ncbi:MAG TPA: hypothetical protein VGJ54_03275 [Streptosporangiaceae bacterium]|jgi:hypothetical protein